MAFAKKISRAALSLLLCLALITSSPAPTYAAVLPSDTISTSTVEVLGASIKDAPDVDAQSGILVDSEGRILWSRDPDSKRAMASITKIMTAVVALEHLKPTDVLTVPAAAASVGGSSADLRAGEKIDVTSLIEGLLVPSGNDAAVTLAVGTAGSVDKFVDLMNAKAKDLGLKNTHYTNPHGLEGKDHHTTASDLALLVRFAMKNELIAKTVSVPSVTIKHSWGNDTVESTNGLIGSFEGANGVKTGFTDEAGYCLASGANRSGQQLWGIILHADTESGRVADSENLLQWGFDHCKPTVLAHKGKAVAEVSVTDLLDTTVPAGTEADVSANILDFDGPVDAEVTLMDVKSPVEKGDVVGSVTWTQRDRMIASAKLVALDAVSKPSFFGRVKILATRGWRSVFGGEKVATSEVSLVAPIVIDPTFDSEAQ